MPRNASGVYTLPATNPVAPYTTIATSWANPTLDDIAQALTNSLDRTGAGGMLAPVHFTDGTLGAPGISFANEVSLGLFRYMSGIMAGVAGGVQVWQYDKDKFTSRIKTDLYGFTAFRSTGYITWSIHDSPTAGGSIYITPSVTINGDDYDYGKALSIQPTGLVTAASMHITGTLTVDGALTAPNFQFTTINCTTIQATGLVNAKDITAQTINTYNRYVTSVADLNFGIATNWICNVVAGGFTINTVSGIPAGSIGRITFLNTHSGPVNFPATVHWPGPTFAKPDFTAGPMKRAIVAITWDSDAYLANVAVF